MDESTIFKGFENTSSPQAASQPSIPVGNSNENSPVSSPQPFGQAAQQPPQPPPISVSPEVSSDSGEGSSKLKIIGKILLGLFAVLLIAGIVFGFVLPRLGQPKNEKVTLIYWGLWEDQKVMDPIISDFEKTNPNITIEYSKQDPKQYADRLQTRIKNGNGPYIFRFHNTWYPVLSDYLLPISSDSVSAKDFKQWYYPVAQNDLIRNGAVYGIPMEIDTLALFINQDSFKAAGVNPPATWEDFNNVAKTLTVKDQSGKIKTAGAAIGSYDNISHAPDLVSLLFAQSGVAFDNISAKKSKASEAMSFYTSFALGSSDSVWDNTLDNSIRAFSAGNVGMIFGYSWDYFTIKAMNPQLNFKVVPVPQLSNQNKTIASYWAEGVSVKSKHQKEAFMFMKFLTQKDTLEKIYTEQSKTRLFGEPYARTDLADKLKNNPNVYPFIADAKDAVSSFFVDSTYEDSLNGSMNEYLGRAVNSIISQATSPESAVDTLDKGVTQVLSKYGQK